MLLRPLGQLSRLKKAIYSSFFSIENSGSRTRTYDIMINSHALLPTELCRNIFKTAWRRPALTKGNPSLQSALRSLTSVFGMGTGVSFSLSPPHYLIMSKTYSLKTGIEDGISNKSKIFYFIWLSPRTISISPLRTSLHFHS